MTPLRPLALALLVSGLLTTGAAAQDAHVAEAMADAEAAPVTGGLLGLHQLTTGHVLAAAEAMDEEMYAFRPSDEVRTAGAILAHVAIAQYMNCATAAGEPSPSAEDFEETATTKAAVLEALRGAAAFCEGVYAGMTDAMGSEPRWFFGQEMPASAVLAFNSAHTYEHYGNLVVYMRMNGVVPPSSR